MVDVCVHSLDCILASFVRWMLSVLDAATLTQPAKRSVWRSGDINLIAFRRGSFYREYNHNANRFDPEKASRTSCLPSVGEACKRTRRTEMRKIFIVTLGLLSLGVSTELAMAREQTCTQMVNKCWTMAGTWQKAAAYCDPRYTKCLEDGSWGNAGPGTYARTLKGTT